MTELRRIDISGQAIVSPKDQPAPMLDWLPIDRLVVDEKYQRGLGVRNWQSIRKIAADFHWSRFTPVLVAPVENGLFAIIDGQHRTHAAALCGFDTVPAMAVHMARAEQATAFAWINSQVIRITPHHVFKAALAAGEPWAVASRDAVEAAGCRLMTYNASASVKKPGEVYSVNLVRDFVAKGHGEAVTSALLALRKYDVKGRVTLYSDYVLRPLVQVLAEEPAFRFIDIAAIFAGSDPYKVLDGAARRRDPSITAIIAQRNALRALFAREGVAA